MRVSSIFGESGDKISEFADYAKRAFGMSAGVVYEYAAVFGNLFSSITADEEENANAVTAMLNTSAVVASKTGRTVSDVMERIRSGLLGNTEAIEDLGIYVNVAMLETTAAFRRMADGRSWEQLSYHEQQQVRMLAILEQAHQKFGDQVSQNSITSISAFSAATDDLKISVGELASGALTPLVKGLTYITQAAGSCVRWFGSLSGTTKAYLGISLALAAGIPAVTLATKGLAAAQAGLRAIQAILIPETLTYATALKAALGWLALAAAAIGVLYAIFGRKKETKSAEDGITDYSKALKNTQINANSAAQGIDNITDSAKALTNELKRSLAGFDELNTLSDSNTAQGLFSVDTSGIEEAANAVNSLSDMDYSIDFDTNAQGVTGDIKGFFSDMWSDIKKGYKDWSKWWQGLGADMYTGIHEGDWEPFLTRLDKKVRNIFGDRWSDYWQEVGEGMYTGIHDGDWEPFLTTLDEGVRKIFGEPWSDFWQEVGDGMYTGIHDGNWEPFLSTVDKGIRFLFGDRWSEFWGDVGDGMYTGIHDGDWQPFLEAVDSGIRDLFGDRWSEFWSGVGDSMYTGIHDGDWLPLLETLDSGVRDIFGEPWSNFWQEVGGDIYDGIFGGTEEAAQALDDLDAKCRQVLGEGWTDFWEGVGEGVYDFTHLEDTLREAVDNRMAEFSSNKPHAATGAIVSRPTEILTGEAGKEAILPLENNTSWMDTLAAKISTAPQSSGENVFHLYLDGRELKNFCVRAVANDRARRGG